MTHNQSAPISSIDDCRAPGRPSTRKDKNGRSIPVRADRDRLLKWFFDQVPRPDLETAMLVSGDKRFHRLNDSFHDPAYRKTSPATLCRKIGISLKDLLDLWHQFNADLASMAMATRLSKIMEQIAVDALSQEKPCPLCDGERAGEFSALRRTCHACDGAGKVRVPGDADSRRTVYEIMGLLGPRKAAESFRKLRQKAAGLLNLK
jgi:hypothetical protein